MKVAILNYTGAVSSSVMGPYDILTKIDMTKQLFGVLNNKVDFEVDIANSLKIDKYLPGFVRGSKTIGDQKKYDLVIIPAMNFELVEKVLKDEKKMIEWIRQQYNAGSEVASVCLGTFLLAAAGILDGRRATTHWMGVPLFRKLYPQVKLEDDKVIIDEGRIYSCDAAFSFTSLMIYLIEKFCGRELALAASKVMMIQVHDSGQNSFAIFDLQRSHADKGIREVQEFIEQNYCDELYVKKLANKFNISNRTLIRRFTEATGNTPLEYIQRVRVEAAKRLLEKGKVGIEQVCVKSGYEDFNFFCEIFRRNTGLSPQAYRRRYANMFNESVLS
ncbi:MAG: helix-turn-helix domain-containing protein [Ignavibacteriaceae bacterium]